MVFVPTPCYAQQQDMAPWWLVVLKCHKQWTTSVWCAVRNSYKSRVLTSKVICLCPPFRGPGSVQHTLTSSSSNQYQCVLLRSPRTSKTADCFPRVDRLIVYHVMYPYSDHLLLFSEITVVRIGWTTSQWRIRARCDSIFPVIFSPPDLLH